MAAHVDFLVREKKPTLCLLFCVGPQVIVRPLLPYLLFYIWWHVINSTQCQCHELERTWQALVSCNTGNRPLYSIISALMGFITLVSKKAKESHDAVLKAAAESGTLCTNL